jgi:dihydroorotase
VFDPGRSWQLDTTRLISRSRHTPFDGNELFGRVRWTLIAGRVAHEGDAANAGRD